MLIKFAGSDWLTRFYLVLAQHSWSACAAVTYGLPLTRRVFTRHIRSLFRIPAGWKNRPSMFAMKHPSAESLAHDPTWPEAELERGFSSELLSPIQRDELWRACSGRYCPRHDHEAVLFPSFYRYERNRNAGSYLLLNYRIGSMAFSYDPCVRLPTLKPMAQAS